MVYNFEAVTTLYDYYGFKGKGGSTVNDIEDAIGITIPDEHKFIPYVQLHEFEALLFSDPASVSSVIGAPNLEPQLRSIVEECGGPEAINDHFDT